MGSNGTCEHPCSLYTKCQILKKTEEKFADVHADLDLSLHEMELQVVEGDNPKLTAQYHAWVERLEAKFAGDPEGLERALKAVGNLYGKTLDLQSQFAKQFAKMVEEHNAAESYRANRRAAVDEFLAAVADEGCTGRTEARGGFLGLKRSEVCNSSASDVEKANVRRIIRADKVFTANQASGMSDIENADRFYKGEYDT